MKLKKLELEDYKLFKGKQEYVFGDRLNLVVGAAGSGKTIMFNALKESLEAPIHGVRLTINGDATTLLEHCGQVFISGEALFQKDSIISILDSEGFISSLKALNEEYRSKGTVLGIETPIYSKIFPSGFSDFDKFLSYVRCMSLGDIAIHIYLYLLKKRQEASLDLPLVIDRPFAVLESEVRAFLAYLFTKLCAQVIIFGYEEDFILKDGTRITGKYLQIGTENNGK